jgi:N-glycosylase/DNA lyase
MTESLHTGGRVSVSASDFALEETLESAQLFRVRRQKEGFLVCAHGERFFVRQRDGSLEAEGEGAADAAFLTHFFALDEPYAAIAGRLWRQEDLRPVIESLRGVRIMRQDPWECLIGFICSSCCNVPRIRRMVEALCLAAGERRGGWRTFPAPGKLPDERRLRRLGLGYRAGYLSRLNRPGMREWLYGLRLQHFDTARRALLSLDGVGEKVADCVLLYSLGFRQAFPVDVWVRRAVSDLYFGGRRIKDRDARSLAADRFGPDAGYAQLLLFHLWRTRRNV